jgi:hypothetical protein
MPARGWSIPINLSGSVPLSDWPAIATGPEGTVFAVWTEGPVGLREIYFSAIWATAGLPCECLQQPDSDSAP